EMQKPPLYYWLVAAIAKLQDGQVDSWAVRLPASLSALLGMAGIFFLAWRRGRPLAGMVAALCLGTMIHYTWMGRVGRIDMPLTAAVCCGLTGFCMAGRSRSRSARTLLLLLGYVAAAAAFLLKGPIGIVLLGLVLVAHLAICNLQFAIVSFQCSIANCKLTIENWRL